MLQFPYYLSCGRVVKVAGTPGISDFISCGYIFCKIPGLLRFPGSPGFKGWLHSRIFWILILSRVPGRNPGPVPFLFGLAMVGFKKRILWLDFPGSLFSPRGSLAFGSFQRVWKAGTFYSIGPAIGKVSGSFPGFQGFWSLWVLWPGILQALVPPFP